MKYLSVVISFFTLFSFAQTNTTTLYNFNSLKQETISMLESMNLSDIRSKSLLILESNDTKDTLSKDFLLIQGFDESKYSNDIKNSLKNFVLDAGYMEDMANGSLVFSIQNIGKFRFQDDYIINYENNILKRLLPAIPGQDFIYCPDFNY